MTRLGTDDETRRLREKMAANPNPPITVTCESGHAKEVFVWLDGLEGNVYWTFAEDGLFCANRLVSRDTYAYENGGCCYRAATREVSRLDVKGGWQP